ncbi:MAG: cupin domain-containing protein [Mesorhizobium sp.]|nr:MAG: cupin domain-containing protein [Mesorhizobium sp.]
MGPLPLSSVRSGICSNEPDVARLKQLDVGISMEMLTDAKEYSVDFIVVEANAKEVTIVHKRTDEFLFVIRGKLLGTVGRQPVELPAGGYVEIRRGTPHTFTNNGPGSVHLVSFCVPKYDSDDVHQVADDA